MRLQIAVQRHDLPEVRVITNTAPSTHGPGRSSTTRPETIADLLTHVNTLIPLESAVGEWGLEDYVVEVAATADQSRTYECFHYQELRDVLREDDEVVVRGLSSEELRERRLGGRMQISIDGRHLIDGLSWGRRLRGSNGGSGRPEVVIPPRKRRRLMVEEGVEEDQRLELGYPPSTELVTLEGNELDEEDNDDEDYDDCQEQDEEEDESESDEGEGVEEEHEAEVKDYMSSSAGQVKARVRFDDADVCEDEGHMEEQKDLDDEEESALEEGDLSENLDEFAAEVQNLLDDPIPATELPRLRGKRKRAAGLDDEPAQSQGGFVGCSSPAEPSPKQANNLQKDSDRANGNAIEEGQNSDSDSDSGASAAELTSSSGSDPSSDSNSDDTSSESGESSSSSDNSGSSARSSTKAASLKKAKTTSAITGQPAMQTHAAVSSSDALPAINGINKQSEKEQAQSTTAAARFIPRTLPRAQGPPGTGMNKTKRNNERKRRKRIMDRLKSEGKLALDANYQDFETYLQQNAQEAGSEQEEPEQGEQIEQLEQLEQLEQPNNTNELDIRREAVLRRLIGSETHPEMQNDKNTTVMPTLNEAQTVSDRTPVASATGAMQELQQQQQQRESSIDDRTPEEAGTKEQVDTEPSPKRAKLDLASSRRMLFNALGVRTPKTPGAEQALREKLSRPTRVAKFKEAESTVEDQSTIAADAKDRWKSKLVVSAAECVAVDKHIEVPPFPFKHPWQVRKEKEQASYEAEQARYEASFVGENAEAEADADDETANANDTQQTEVVYDTAAEQRSQTLTTSRTLTAGTAPEDDNIAVPADFENLPVLTRSDLHEGLLIAYKELHMNDRFEPEESPYRTAKILVNDNGVLELRLSILDRRSAEVDFDEDTGERIYKKFDVPVDEEDEEDDGLRTVSFLDMIRPKLVQRSEGSAVDVQQREKDIAGTVLADSGSHGDEVMAENDNAGVAPSSSNNANCLGTPTRTEINGMIQDAAFDSSLDKQLLQPLAEPEQDVTDDEAQLQNELEPHKHNGLTSSSLPSSSPVQASGDTGVWRESSAPSESMVESVKYPSLSLLELATSTPAQSSSHQDAQRLTSAPVVETSTVLPSPLPEPSIAKSQQEQSSLPSEVPETQIRNSFEQQDMAPKASGRAGAKSPSPQPGNAMNNDVGEIDDNESLDSNGFPSLRFLSSSQISRNTDRQSADRVKKELKQESKNTVRKSPRTQRTTARTSDWSDSETQIKASQSQAHRTSQILDDTIITDLTQSSPPGSPEKPAEVRNPSRSQRGGTSSQQASAFRKSFENLGEKSFLKRKKRSL